MSSPSGAALSPKSCTLCGVDLAGKPRTKDSHGHYFCDPCFQSALARKHAAAPSPVTHAKPGTFHIPLAGIGIDDGDSTNHASSSPVKHATLPLTDSTPEQATGNDISLLPEIIDRPPEVSPSSTQLIPCPSCNHTVSAGSLLCTSCGFNFATNRKPWRFIKLPKPPPQPGPGLLWSQLVGWCCLCIGLLLICLYASITYVQFTHRNSGALIGIPPLLLMFLLARGGWLIIQQKPLGVRILRAWSYVMVIVLALAAFGVSALNAELAHTEPFSSTIKHGQITLNAVTALKHSLPLINFIFIATWVPPIFLLGFFFVPDIRRDVQRWG